MMDANSDKMKECQHYFRERPVFQKVFERLKAKYESLGHMGGTIRLSGLTDEEKVQLGGFLQKDYIGSKVVSVSCRDVERALEGSRFAGIGLQDILEEYFRGRLVGNKEAKEAREREQQIFFRELLEGSKNQKEASWLVSCIEQKNGVYKTLLQLYRTNVLLCREVMEKVFLAGANLPVSQNRLEMLPVFAAEITGNPHYFDEKNVAHQLLCAYLSFCYPQTAHTEQSQTEQKSRLLYAAGIVKDDLSNYVLAYGLRGQKTDGTLHGGLEGFYSEREPVQITLQTMNGLQRLWSEKNKVYMVENPAVFSYLCGKYPKETFICGNGQLRLAAWVLLEKMEQVDTLLYAGDFDPEGLLIAQKLKRRFPDKVKFWNYKSAFYLKYLSEKEIGERSKNKLGRIIEPELIELKELLLKYGKAVYQEAMLEEYCLVEDSNELRLFDNRR